jgi:CTP-dependent riboflavin kinase
MTRQQTEQSDRSVPFELTPRSQVRDLLADSGGQLPERTLVTELAYSTAACERVLSELETTGEITRRQTGPQTVVTLAE